MDCSCCRDRYSSLCFGSFFWNGESLLERRGRKLAEMDFCRLDRGGTALFAMALGPLRLLFRGGQADAVPVSTKSLLVICGRPAQSCLGCFGGSRSCPYR